MYEERKAQQRIVKLHRYRALPECEICVICGAAKHRRKYKGFKYWFAGLVYDQEPACKTTKSRI